jgi:hypothetical protein
MSKLDQRAERVRIIAHTLHGSVLDRDGHLMMVEIPADLLGAAMGMLSMGGFGMPNGVGKQSTRMAPRRITTMQGAMVSGQDEALTAYHRGNRRSPAPRRPGRGQAARGRRPDNRAATAGGGMTAPAGGATVKLCLQSESAPNMTLRPRFGLPKAMTSPW